MELRTQIISIIFSIIYGCLFGVFYNLNYKFLHINKLRYRVLNSLLFSLDMLLIYFIIMLRINNGNIRIVFLILLFFSFILTNKFTKKLRKIVKCLKRENK